MFKEPLHLYTLATDFGETVQIDGVAVNALFDREYASDSAFDFSVGNADPQLTLADDVLPDNIQAATITVRGIAYTVAEIQPDGTGMTTLQLKVKSHDPPLDDY